MRNTILVLLLLTTSCFSRSDVARGFATSGEQYLLESIRKECIALASLSKDEFRECRVSEFSQIGTVGTRIFYYAIYCLIPHSSGKSGGCSGDSFTSRYHRSRALAIFARDGSSDENVRLLLERAGPEIGVYVYEKPGLVNNAAGTILYAPIRVDGTANENASEYFLLAADEWQRIESETWRIDLRRRIPSNLEIWKGTWPDLRTMQAEVALYRKGDSNCCPTGGAAHVRLSIQDGKFVIESVSIDKQL